MSDLAILLGGLISVFGVGFVVGRWLKTIRQFFDHV